MHHNIVLTHNGYAKMHVLMPIYPLQPHCLITASFIACMVIPFAYVVHYLASVTIFCMPNRTLHKCVLANQR